MRYVSYQDLNPGMKIARAILNENGDVLINKDIILSQSLIGRLEEREIAGVYIEDALSEDVEIEDLVSQQTRQKGIKALKNMDVDAALSIAQEIADEISQIETISFDMMNLRSKSDYTYQHSINVSIFATSIGIGMGMRKGLLKELAASALLHDVGKLCISSEILDKPGKLTEEEYLTIQKHAEYGYELLKENSLVTSKIRMGVYMHHENEDGSGYPLGIAGDQIYSFARIIHVADVYDALNSQRSYKKASLPGECIQFLKDKSGSMFQKEIVDIFSECVPLYPKGRMVVLNTKEKALVIENTQNHTLRPIVRLLDGTTLDLSDEKYEKYDIIEVL